MNILTFRIALALLLTLTWHQEASAQWTKLEVASGIALTATQLEEMRDTIYAPYNVVRFSTDLGNTWQQGNHLPVPSSGPITIDTGYWIAATSKNGWISYDRGWQWQELSPLPLFAGAPSATSWHKGALFASGGGLSMVARSFDTGRTWSHTIIEPPIEVAALGSNSRFIFVGGSIEGRFSTNLGIFRSSDNGASWSNVSCPKPTTKFRSLLVYDSMIVAASTSEIFFSSDDGDTWQAATTHWGTEPILKKLRRFGDNYVALTTNGLSWSRDGARNWYVLASDLPVSNSTDVLIHSGFVFVTSWDGTYRRALEQLKVDYLELYNPQDLIQYLEVRGQLATVTLANVEREGQLSVVNVTGSVLFRDAFSSTSTITISTEYLPPGLYFLIVEANSKQAVRKLVISR
jgi:hypothetical protein